LYGEAINLILLLESNLNADDVESALHDAFMVIRPTLFLNLAASNLKLSAADGALQCCNTAIQLCNAPGLLYSDLASSKDIVDIVHPVAQAMLQTMAKALFRRGTCFEALGDVNAALKDYLAAASISPDNQELKLLVEAAEERMRCTTNTEKTKATNHSAESIRTAARRNDGLSKESMCVNGGRCWMRKGLWSQTVTDVIVYLPLQVVHLELYAEEGEVITADFKHHFKLLWKNLTVAFTNHSITMSISTSTDNDRSITIDLEHAVISSECTWTLDLDSDPTLESGDLIIYLSKAPKFEWFPGQEVR
jgi:tetratricopeptide (TPR) repeat protein